MKGLPPAHHPHLTLKFFGSADIDPRAVERLVDSRVHEYWEPRDFNWESRIWPTRTEAVHHVLVLTKYPEAMRFQHRLFDIIRDQHTPWNPHITVPKNFFFMVEDQGFSPENCDLAFGEIELCLGGDSL